MGQVEPNFKIMFLLFNILFFVSAREKRNPKLHTNPPTLSFLPQCMGAGLLSVGIYNIVSLLSFDVFARSVYITGGVLFVMVGAAKMVLSLLGLLGFFLENRIILTIVRLYANPHVVTIHTLIPILPYRILKEVTNNVQPYNTHTIYIYRQRTKLLIQLHVVGHFLIYRPIPPTRCLLRIY